LWFKDFLCCMIFFDKGRRLDHARKDVIAGVDTFKMYLCSSADSKITDIYIARDVVNCFQNVSLQ
ncbi:hypothetical protein BY457_105237, partial [Marinilabilia salmonicolor]